MWGTQLGTNRSSMICAPLTPALRCHWRKVVGTTSCAAAYIFWVTYVEAVAVAGVGSEY